MLSIEGLNAAYHKGNPVIRDLDMTLAQGEHMVILGSNGAGKTTFANCFYGLVPHISGMIQYNGTKLISVPVHKVKAIGLSYFMQGAPVFPQMTVRQNLALAERGVENEGLAAFIDEARKELSIFKNENISGVPAGTLSGGERSQLSLLMCLQSKPSLLILDEPFAGLSASTAGAVMNVLKKYADFSSASMILIAQDKKLAEEFSENQFVLAAGKLRKL